MKTLLKAVLLSLSLGFASLALAQETQSININSADAEMLTQLPGIGEAKAQAIIEDREANGPFNSAEDLSRINGIGDATVESLRDQIAY
ncbi:ComEA family DNA-binding protein [Halomonas sp. PR-M31]|uniref:ComEA family DNA-binding protein n=1 Tax=Halomonas sp. PR-M31 TaxID=1471202 RepID=UPI000651FE4B|nr:ComEA family DNA-binding protein [Halomonas sp. PR-M31]